ncbi:MAG TPA: DUF177 domain-containing protein [Mesorhizobium sp.]|jgi:hypothetical protein|nr:DUF177 domain-containing protein [Mesorhizobium sp.]
MTKRSENLTRSPVSFPVHVARLPQKGMPVLIEANEKQREALAAAHGVLDVESYRADLQVRPWKRNGVEVTGRVTARIVQECVVTLEPVENAIDEPVEAVFLPEQSKLGRLGFEGGGEIMIDAHGPDSPETFSGDTVDVGALAEELFALAIDPYPRKPGAALPSADEEAPRDEEPDEDWRRQLQGIRRKP